MKKTGKRVLITVRGESKLLGGAVTYRKTVTGEELSVPVEFFKKLGINILMKESTKDRPRTLHIWRSICQKP